MSEIEIAPTPLARVAWASVEAGMAALLIVLSGPSRLNRQSVQAWLVFVIGLVLLVAAVEFPWKKVLITDVAIRDRRWFHWRELPLPPRVLVGKDSRGRVAIADETGTIIFRFVREFGKPSDIERRVMQFFAQAGRLASAPPP
jgi:hypothetical protein